jgi:subtilisin-like proprotein convertase family protein
MKTGIYFGLMAAFLTVTLAHGTLYTENFDNVNTAIPQGNPVGVTFSQTVSDIPAGETVGGLTVSFDVSGGYNGNLYGYLVAPNGTMVVLLNQPGVTGSTPFGYGGSGYNVTLEDTAADNIQTTPETTGVQFSGTYQADGTLANMNGSAADGTWDLYFADLANGGGTSTLQNWSLGITAVPEPVGIALGVFAGITGLWWCLKICLKKAISGMRLSPAQIK